MAFRRSLMAVALGVAGVVAPALGQVQAGVGDRPRLVRVERDQIEAAPTGVFYPDGSVTPPGGGLRAIQTVYDNTNTTAVFAYAGESEGVGAAYNGVLEAVQLGQIYVSGASLTQISLCVHRVAAGSQTFKIFVRLWENVNAGVPPGTDVVSGQVGPDLFYQSGGAGFTVTAPFTTGFSLALPAGIVLADRNVGIEVRLVLSSVMTPEEAANPVNTHPGVSFNCLSVQTQTGGALTPLNPGPPSVGTSYPADGIGHLWRDINDPGQPAMFAHDGRYVPQEDVRDLGGQNRANLYLKVLSDICACFAQNDDCGNATAITLPGAAPSSAVLSSQSTLGATIETLPPPPCGVSDPANQAGVWYSVVGRGRVTHFSTCGAGAFDAVIKVYSGTCAVPVCVNGQDNAGGTACPANPWASTATVCAGLGIPYLVYVRPIDDFAFGVFNLTVTEGEPCPVACVLDSSGAVDLSAQNATCGIPTGPFGACAGAAPAVACQTYFDRLSTGLDGAVRVRGVDWFRYTVPAGASGTQVVRARAEFPAIVTVLKAADAGNPCAGFLSPGVGEFDLVPCVERDFAFVGASGEVFLVQIAPASWTSPTACGPGGGNAYRLGVFTAACLGGTDCFTRGPAGPIGTVCAGAILTHARPGGAAGFISGGANGVADGVECVADWDGDGCIVPADVSAFVASWFFSAQNPGDTGADIDCDGSVQAADLAGFVNRWLQTLASPAADGCV